MKICYISQVMSSHANKWASWFANRGHEIHLITHRPRPLDNVIVHDVSYKHDPSRSRLERYLSFDFHSYSLYRLKTLFIIRRLVRQIAPDILHLHTLYFPSFHGVYAGIKPLVVTPWNGDVVWIHKRSWFEGISARRALRRADLITNDSEEMRRKCLSLGVPARKLQMVCTGAVDLQHFNREASDDNLRESLGLDHSPVVISTRSLVDDYNIHILVQAIPIVLARIPDAKFIFTWTVADNLYQQQIKNMVAVNGSEKSVRFVGHVEQHSDMAKYYALADVFVSVSSLDSTPASLMEAMASGVLPIVGELPPILESVIDGWNGYIVPLGNPQALAQAIVRGLTHPEERRLFAQRNLELVREKADYNKEMAKMEELYKFLIKQKK